MKKLDDLPEAQLNALRQRLGVTGISQDNLDHGALKEEPTSAAKQPTDTGEYGLINDMEEEMNSSAILDKILGISDPADKTFQ